MEQETVNPAMALQHFASELEAAITLTLAAPDKPAVHKLRSTTRRLEAQLFLLTEVGALDTACREVKHLRREVRRLRRAAGSLRDFDVLDHMLGTEPLLPRHEAPALHAALTGERDRRAADLTRLLPRHLPGVVAALKTCTQQVKAAHCQGLTAEGMLSLIERWRAAQPDGLQPRSLAEKHLHKTRKVAKLARYMAESLPQTGEVPAAATRFETVQDAGGRWHDWLEFEAAAAQYLGPHHALAFAAREQTAVARAIYLQALAQEL